MPGLSQLQQLNTDLLTLGDEVAIRAARSEKPVTVPIPEDVEDIDDSELFRMGLPMLSEEEQAQADAAAAEAEREANDFSDITGEDTGSDEEEKPAAKVQAEAAPDMSDLISPIGDVDFSDLDLSDFEEPEEEKEPEEPEEIPLEDLDLDSLLAPASKPEPKPAPAKAAPKASPKKQVEPPAPPKRSAAEEEADAMIANLLGGKNENYTEKAEPAFPAEEVSENEALLKGLLSDEEPVTENIPELTEELPELTEELPELTEDETLESASPVEAEPLEEIIAEPEDMPEPAAEIEPVQEESVSSTDSESSDDFGGDFSEFSGTDSLSMDLPDEFNEEPTQDEIRSARKMFDVGTEEDTSGDASEEVKEISEPEESFKTEGGVESSVDEPLPDFDTSALEDFPAEPVAEETPDFGSAAADDFSAESPSEEVMDFDAAGLEDFPAEPSFGEVSGLDEFPADQEEKSSDAPSETVQEESYEPPEVGDSLGQDFGNITVADYEGNIPEKEEPLPDEEVPDEEFDTSGMEGVDFSSDSGSDFELGTIDTTEDEDDIFNIPGFSDTVTADINKKPPEPEVQEEPGARVKNSFTDAEYERFKKNLESYPLNVRIALEDLVVKNEFTDDAVFGILEKVLRKVPARTLAGELEKMLDISLQVPRDFERRSAAEYEAYKQSLEYQLKNRIIPGAILSVAAAVLLFCVVEIVDNLIYRPLHANSLYKQGYALLEDNQYPQSEEMFDEAIRYNPKKSWFFKYAQGYREHRQYERSRMMYRAILQRFDHDRQAGLEWAEMESEDLYNYEEAERIMKREVLDYHINDGESILKLGDVYLDWATELEPVKFRDAFEQYSIYELNYGATNESQARKMIYYIRTDDLREVLKYKNFFFPQKKALSSSELTELSGYLLDKRFGKLRPAEESLREHIEDLRELLERAVKTDESNPVALYNLARYFIETKADESAINVLRYAIEAFESQNIRKKRDTYKYINTFRLLGEQYELSREYILAEESFGRGIDMFEKENESSGFESDENIGHLYADLADIEYFISLDNESALRNYISAVDNKYDNASVRYRIGYIHYNSENYSQALGSFIKSHESEPNDRHLLLALADTLTKSNDYYVARGYYERLIDLLDVDRRHYGLMMPQSRGDHNDIVDTYMKASNNLGVVLSRLASKTGDSMLNAKAIVNLQESLRAWDSLTRNQNTMIRMEGSNLAEQNIKYITASVPEYESEIYTEIPRTLYGETVLE